MNMYTQEDQYLRTLDYIMKFGAVKEDRTGVGTRSMFAQSMRFNLERGFPLFTTKRVYWKGVVEELLWFISGQTNIKPLVDKGVSIWTDWPLQKYNKSCTQDGMDTMSREEFEERIRKDSVFATYYGELGPVYGKQWRSWEVGDGTRKETVDQLQQVIDTLRTNPDDRRMIVSAWNVGEVPEMLLPPCHCMFQFYSNVRRTGNGEQRYLSCHIYQRSCDMFLGVPFNIASYALLTCMVAHITGHKPLMLVWTGGDCHVYRNHFGEVELQLSRQPRIAPTLELHEINEEPIREIDDFGVDNIVLHGYNPWPSIKAPVAV